MHKQLTTLALSLLAAATFSSCIKDEPLNAECDITGVDASWLLANKDILRGNPIVQNTRVAFIINPGSDRSALSPRFSLTEGATITAEVDGQNVEANGLERDFSTPKTYTVHSQDGQWQKDYEVSFSPMKPISLLSFENYKLDKDGEAGRYYEFFERDDMGELQTYWATGNAGFALTGMGKTPLEYPTIPYPDGVRGSGVKLTTLSTGSFGNSVGMPIAAGNLFIGEFRVNQAMLFPRKATQFGLPLVTERPVSLEGYYKYKAGELVTDAKQAEHPELHDTADIYAVVYEISTKTEIAAGKKFTPLNGDNVLSSDRIVLMARIQSPLEYSGALADLAASEWNFFSEPFQLLPGKTFSEERLKDEGYAIAVVATSSRQGAYFEGAVGSTLYLDELRIVWEGDE